MSIYSVKVRYATKGPFFNKEVFFFDNEVEANAFCFKAKEYGWLVQAPVVVIEEIFTCDSACGWVWDEINAEDN